MWTRKELKEKGKRSFKRNYWKAVLVSLLLVFMVRGAVNFGFGGRGGSSNDDPHHRQQWQLGGAQEY